MNLTYNPSIDIPGVPGADQTIWFVANDLDLEKQLYFLGSPGLGIEMQTTIWGYNREGALGNAVFRKYKLINKSEIQIDSFYVGVFSDPDLGVPYDDFAGCDTTLNLGYAYSGRETDEIYKPMLPAAGFELLQGPVINGSQFDSAIVNGSQIAGKRNLDMTGFTFFACDGTSYCEPRLRDYEKGALLLKSIFMGTEYENWLPHIDPESGETTNIIFAGDPVTGEGWIDGDIFPPGDRKFIMSSGPFTMSPSDTQEVVFAQIVAVNDERIEAFKLLRFYSELIHDFYDGSMKVETKQKPQAPKIIESYDKISDDLSFGWSDYPETRAYNGYTFQGYNVYQFISPLYANKENGIKLAVYDKVDDIKEIYGQVMNELGYATRGIVQNGNDNGVQNNVLVDHDYLTDSELIKGKEYHYGVSAYYYNPDKQTAIESETQVYSVIYKENVKGLKYNDQIQLNHVSGNGDDQDITVRIVNPSQLNGHTYKINYSETGDRLVWNLIDKTEGKTLLTSQKVYPGVNDDNIYPVVDGMEIRVFSKSPNLHRNGIVEIAYGGTPLSREQWDSTGVPFHGNTVWHNPNSTNDYLVSRIYLAGYNRKYGDYEIRFTEGGGYGVFPSFDNTIASVPFELWDIGIATPDDKSDDIRLIPFLEPNDEWRAYSHFQWGSDGVNSFFGYPESNVIYFVYPESEDGYANFASVCRANGIGNAYPVNSDGSANGYWAEIQPGSINNYIFILNDLVFCDIPGNQVPPPSGTVIRFNTTKPNTVEDEFEFISTITTDSAKTLLTDYTLYQNYPNPFNAETTIRYTLKEKGIVNITIYDVLGRKVKELLNEERGAGVFEINFNAANLSSGIYFYRLQSGSFAETKKFILIK